MRLKLKWILTCLVALAVALVVAAYAILSTLEFENLRGVVQAEVKAATGRDFVIAGPIELEISFTPAIAMEDITLANASWGSQAEMVQVRRFELEVALLPLLSGEIRVRRLVVFDPDVLLETDKAGRGNWVMTRGGERAETTKDTTATGAPTLPDIDTMLVENGSVTFRDGETGEEIRFRASEMTTRETDDAVPVEIFIEGAYDEHPLTVEGAVGTFRQFMGDKVYPVRLSVSAGNAEVDVEGSIARPMSGQGIDVQVEVTGKDLAELGAVAGAVLPAVGPYDLAVQIAQDGETTYRLTGLAANVEDVLELHGRRRRFRPGLGG